MTTGTKRRWVRLLALLFAFALVAAACGNDSDGDGGASTDDDTADADTADADTADDGATDDGEPTDDAGDDEAVEDDGTSDGTPSDDGDVAVDVAGIEDGVLKIGGVTQPAQWPGMDEGVQARIGRFNDEGGLPGITEIEYVGARDDGGDADRNLSLVRELVQKDGVFAVVPITPTGMQPAAGEFLASEQVPFIGYGYAPVMCQNDYGFGQGGCTVPGIQEGFNQQYIQQYREVLGVDTLDGIRFAVSSRAEAGGDLFGDAYAAGIEEAGGEVVYNEANVPGGGTADMQPFVDAILGSDPDIIIVITDFASVLALKGFLAANGFEGPIFDYAAYVPGLLESQEQVALALEGSYVVSTVPMLEDDSPYVQQLLADFEAAGLEVGGSGSLIGYIQADLLISMLEQAAPDYGRLAEIVNEGFTSEPLDGGLVVTYPEYHTTGAPCAGLTRVVDAQYVVESPFTCASA